MREGEQQGPMRRADRQKSLQVGKCSSGGRQS